MTLNLALRGLYTTEHSWAPVSSHRDLFIRPNRRDNAIKFPDMAEGRVRAIHFASASRDLRKAKPSEPADAYEDEAPSVPSADPVALAIATLGARVEQLRGTLKWVGGFIVLALLFLAVR